MAALAAIIDDAARLGLGRRHRSGAALRHPIGDPTASLAFTPAKLGLPYDGEGLLNALLRAGAALAMEMFATANPMPAERALRAGMLNHLVPETGLGAFHAGDGPPHRRERTLVGKQRQGAPARSRRRAAAPFRPGPRLHEGRRAALDSADYGEGLAAFAEKRPGRFAGS